MKICIVGAGAIGGWIGTRLALRGHAVSAYARGATLAALRSDGWRLRQGGSLLQAAATAADDARQLGAQDAVVIALKAPSLPPLAPALRPLIGPDTFIVTAMNGVPWWFFDGLEGQPPLRLDSVDPGGRMRALLPGRQVLGCVVHATCSTPEPGLVQHGFGNGLILGEAVGEPSKRAHAFVETLKDAGFDATLSPRIQRDIWYKLWGNMTMNPVSALTGASSDRILDEPLIYAMCLRAMAEAAAIGARIGCPIEQGGEERMAVTRKLGAFRTSMLQDLEAGKPLEIDALLGAVQEIGQQVAVPTPVVDGLLGLTRLLGATRGLYAPTRAAT
jgi:2-dehydropantoate 2-reductase